MRDVCRAVVIARVNTPVIVGDCSQQRPSRLVQEIKVISPFPLSVFVLWFGSIVGKDIASKFIQHFRRYTLDSLQEMPPSRCLLVLGAAATKPKPLVRL